MVIRDIVNHWMCTKAILPVQLIQEEQLSVTRERMCNKFW